MSPTKYEKIKVTLELYHKLEVAEIQSANPEGCINHKNMFYYLRKRLLE